MAKVKAILNYIISHFPTKIPLGKIELEEWAKSLRPLLSDKLNNVPDDDILFVLTTNITHLGPKVDRLPKQAFVRILHAAAAKQVASQVFQDIKQRQKEQQEAANVQAQKEQPNA